MPVLKSALNPTKSGGGGGGGSALSQSGAAAQAIGSGSVAASTKKKPVNTTAIQTAVKQTTAPPPDITPDYAPSGGGGYGSGGGGAAAPATNPLDSPAYMTYVNELMRQRQALEATRDRDTNATDQNYGQQVTRTNEEAARGRTQIDEAWAGRNLTRSGARLNDQQQYSDAVTRQLSDLMLAQQERRNAIAQAYTNQVNELRRQQAMYALQYGIPIDPNNPTLIPV